MKTIVHSYVIFIILLVVSNIAKSQRQIMSYPLPTPQINITAAGIFNSQTQKCCLGSIHDSVKAANQKCCGADVYDSSRQLCCKDTVLEMSLASACCGNATINTDQSICCEEREVDIPQQDASLISYARCCGLHFYDSRIQTCCSTTSGMKIVGGADKLCCEEELYDDKSQVCCVSYKNGSLSFKVIPTEGNKTICCGDTLADYSTEYCCDNKIVKLDGCCDKKTFNTSTQICCNNQDVTEKNGKNMQCCGEKVYDESSHICCYDPGNYSPTIVQKTDSNQTSCCGMKPYDAENEICCYQMQKVIIKQNKLDYECCGNLSFNSAIQQCCGGKPIDIGTSTDVCCGDIEVYNPKTKICCTKYSENGTLEDHAITDNPDFRLSCCGLQTFDPFKQMCCGTTVFPFSRNIGCCGDQVYDFTKEVCCTDTVFTKESSYDACCFYGTTDARPEYHVFYPHETI